MKKKVKVTATYISGRQEVFISILSSGSKIPRAVSERVKILESLDTVKKVEVLKI